MDHRRLDLPRARPPMRRGLKLITYHDGRRDLIAARAAPYEKGTESAVRYPDPPHCIASLQLTVLQDNSPLPPHTHDIRIRGFAVRVSYPHPVAQHARRGGGVCVLRTSGRLRGDARPMSRVADAPLDNSVGRISAVCLPTQAHRIARH